MSIPEALSLLTRRQSTDVVTNFYLNNVLLSNLRVYLEYLVENPPDYALVGEAPGYKGCLLTGIPFTSQHILKNSDNVFFNLCREKLHILGAQRENTASVIWKQFDKCQTPLFWNAFPYHPHTDKNKNTNRKPTVSEIKEGRVILEIVLKLVKPKIIIGVGQASHVALTKLNLSNSFQKVRHPSYGGVKEFIGGLERARTGEQ